jgi:hypothetical protein
MILNQCRDWHWFDPFGKGLQQGGVAAALWRHYCGWLTLMLARISDNWIVLTGLTR